MNVNETSEHKITGYTFSPNNRSSFVGRMPTQDITFRCNKVLGHDSTTVTMILSNGLFEAAEHEIIINKKELTGLLKFLLNDQSNVSVSIEKLIDKVIILPLDFKENNFEELQKQVIEALNKATESVKK